MYSESKIRWRVSDELSLVIFTTHARVQMAVRDISEDDVLEVLNNPQQTIEFDGVRTVFQSRSFDVNRVKEMLLRVFVEESSDGLIVVSTYQTSKISKYWSGESLS
jgi:hypothetical protein